MKKAISARIDEDVLTYIKNNHNNLNGLINELLEAYVIEHKRRQILLNL